MASQTLNLECALDGQPDSTAVSPDESRLAIAIENECDEESDDGVTPQLPPGSVVVFRLKD